MYQGGSRRGSQEAGPVTEVVSTVIVALFLMLALVLLTVLAALPAEAGAVTPLAEVPYRVSGGDVNGDGRPDILLWVPDRMGVTVLDDLVLPMPLPPEAPSFVLLSRDGGYDLQMAPSRSLRNHRAWRPGGYQLLFADLLGDGSQAILIRALSAGGVTLTVVAPDSGGPVRLLQVLTPGLLGVDPGDPEVTVSLEHRNDDGRADLVIRRNAAASSPSSPPSPPQVFLAREDGSFAPDPEGELLAVWTGFCDALRAQDIAGALAYVDDAVDGRYREAFEALGPAMASIPGQLSAPALVSLAPGPVPDMAEFLVTDTSTGEPLLHFITFIRQGGRWVLASF
jgi:hypothetical protein